MWHSNLRLAVQMAVLCILILKGPLSAVFNSIRCVIQYKNSRAEYQRICVETNILRPESAHENEHRGKWKKKITATVIDIVSKCKISIQVPHTEIVRW